MADDNLSNPEQDPTHKLTPFERTVLQRFDQVDERLDKLEVKALDTKPIWAQALKEIAEVKTDISKVKADVAEVKADVAEVKAQGIEIKAKVTVLDRRMQNVERAIVALIADGGLLTPPQ